MSKIYVVCRVTGSSVWQSSFPHYYGTNAENSELLVHSTCTYFYDSLVIILRRPIKRRSISLSPSSESLAPSSDSFVNQSICCYLALHSRNFVRQLGICNPICVNFYNWCAMSLTTIQWKNEVSILINGWVTANYSVSQPPFCPPSSNFVIGFVSNFWNWIPVSLRTIQWKKRSFYINKWLSYSQL